LKWLEATGDLDTVRGSLDAWLAENDELPESLAVAEARMEALPRDGSK
jgi:hypothetical protein